MCFSGAVVSGVLQWASDNPPFSLLHFVKPQAHGMWLVGAHCQIWGESNDRCEGANEAANSLPNQLRA